MRKSKKLFFILGVLTISFYIFNVIIFYAFISILMFIGLLICIIGIIRKKFLFIDLLKFSICLFLIFFLIIPNPLYWPSQINRHIDRSLIITPNAECIKELNNTNQFWSYLENYTSYNITEFNNLNIKTKLEIYNNFILFKVKYCYDFNNYYVLSHTATPEEVLNRGMDDCQGRCVVLVSFLQYLGYDAWCAETPFHWYTIVYYNNTRYGLNRGDASEPLCIFNGKKVVFPTPISTCIYSILFDCSDYVAKFSLSYPYIWIILIIIPVFLNIILISVLKFPKKYNKNQWLIHTLLGTGFFYIEILIAYLISLYFPIIFNLVILTLITFYLFILKKEYLFIIYTKIKKFYLNSNFKK